MTNEIKSWAFRAELNRTLGRRKKVLRDTSLQLDNSSWVLGVKVVSCHILELGVVI